MAPTPQYQSTNDVGIPNTSICLHSDDTVAMSLDDREFAPAQDVAFSTFLDFRRQ